MMRPLASAPNTRAFDGERMLSLLAGVTVLIGLMLFMGWTHFHTQISVAILAVQDILLDVIGLFTRHYDVLHANLHQAIPDRVSYQTLWTLCTITGIALRWPSIALIAVLAAWCLTRAPQERFRKRFGRAVLQGIMARIHPIGRAWVGGRLKLSEPAPPDRDLRPLDPALRPSEWKARYAPDDLDTAARVAAARAALGAQLGDAWNGPSAASPIIQCLFMAFTLQIRRQKQEAMDLLEQLSAALAGHIGKNGPARPIALPKRFARGMRAALRRGDWADAIAITGSHAYTAPALMSLLQRARLRTGVFNPGLFSAVQLVDRQLWLVLAAVSYPRDGLPPWIMSTASCVEAAGAIEHWQAECSSERSLDVPQVNRTLAMLIAAP